jgi:glycosyltransferase involved in cell wall biosynthesis
LLGGGAGLVPADAAALRDALRALALDAELRDRLGRLAVERAAEYDVAAVADGYERLYARVAP